jgi:hypothetical protein
MKIWPLLIGIIVILAIFCSPGFAIPSKSDLISFYKGQSVPTTPTPTPIPTPTPQTPSWYITPTSTPINQVQPVGSISVISDPAGASVYLDGTFKGFTPITITGVSPTCGFLDQPGRIRGYYINEEHFPHQIKLTKMGYQEYTISDVLVTEGKTTSVSATLTPISAWFVLPSKEELISADYWETQSSGHYATDLPSAGKPNIYLYSDRDLPAQVRLAPENAITVSEPAYQLWKGWRAEVRNGSLNGTGDFLFYEALVPDAGWQKKEGFVIRAGYREQDMAFMLGQYGFNEKETVEFIDYWARHLAGDVDYVFYRQETGAVNRVMPLYISPQPDRSQPHLVLRRTVGVPP